MGVKRFLAAILAASAMVAPLAAAAQSDAGEGGEAIYLGANGSAAQTATVPAGKSTVLRFDRSVTDVMVGDAEIADVIPLTDRSIYVIGKAVGRTSLTLLSRGKKVAGVVDLNVSHDLFGLKKRLYDMMPDEPIEVRADGPAIILSGAVSDSAVASQAATLAANYAAGGEVVNLMSTKQSQQVMLAVRFAEVSRSALKQVGVSTDFFFNSGKAVGAFQTGRQVVQNYQPTGAVKNGPIQDLISDPQKFGSVFGKFALGDVDVDLLLDALDKKGIISILAEPNLIAVSGQTASFLAGGEFPVPVGVDSGDGRGRIQIEFKEFGVRLSFTPTVVGDRINLVVEPEVSELDRQNSVVLNDIVIPGLTTRRARTTVDLKNGQSFSIAGLMQRKFIDDISQMPGVGDVPVLGALARNAGYRHEDTELAIIITAYLVQPSTPDALTTPYDHLIAPSELEMLLLGRIEGGPWPMRRPTVRKVLTGEEPAPAYNVGLDGKVGYVVK